MKKISIIGVFLALAMFLTGCAGYSPDVDETAVEQNDYWFFRSDKTLIDCYEPGTSGWGGVGNKVFNYPAGQRTYSFTGTSSDAELEPVPVVTSDGQTLRVPGFVKFTLTQDCNDLYDFHKKVGVKYNAYEDAGWNTLLNDYLGVAVTAALNDATGDAGWLELYTNASVRKDLEQELNQTLQTRINSSLGGAWIKVNGVSLSKPLASQTLVDGLEASEKAKLDNQAQVNKNATARTKYETLGDCKKEVSEDWCAIFFLADQGKIDLLPIPNGGNLNVTRP